MIYVDGFPCMIFGKLRQIKQNINKQVR